MSFFRTDNLLFPTWIDGRLVNFTSAETSLIEHDVYVKGASMRAKLEDQFNIGIGLVSGSYNSDQSTMKFVSRRLTVISDSPLNLTIPRDRMPQLRRLQQAETFHLPSNNQTELRLVYIYPDEVVEYLLRNRLISILQQLKLKVSLNQRIYRERL